jgi:hypothetical protein
MAAKLQLSTNPGLSLVRCAFSIDCNETTSWAAYRWLVTKRVRLIETPRIMVRGRQNIRQCGRSA